MKPIRSTARLIVLLVLSFSTLSCTNSEWFLSFLYNRLDNKMYSEMSDYADFDRDQKAQIRELVDKFHHWHRVTQLPMYANFLREVSAELTSEAQVSYAQVRVWSEQVEQFGLYSSRCNPMNFAASIITELTDEQIEDIQLAQLEMHEEATEKLMEGDNEERLNDISKSLSKNLKRLDLSISDAQEDALLTTIKSQPDLRQASLDLSWQWNLEFQELLANRNQDDFPLKLQQHLLSFETLIEDHYPEEFTEIRHLWNEFFTNLINANISQSQGFPNWLQRFADNMDAISKKVPRDQQELNPSDFCNITADLS